MNSSNHLAIAARGLTKAYRIWEGPSSRIVAPALEAVARRLPARSTVARKIAGRAKRYYRDFHALTEVSFELHRGEAIGIIGRNGSGKSTLLQIVAGTLEPTAGEVSAHGRVAALLELGSGFNSDFTGRENVYLNAAVLGFSRAQTDERFDRIAAFADIGDFIDQPVKVYSSGMVMRLAFAVAMHVDPEVLIVDEALSVGDARFQLKCSRAIDLILERGVSLLFVSHDLSMVKRLCSRAILLEQGRMLYTGKPNDVANLYSKLIAEGGTAASVAEDIEAMRRRAGEEAAESGPSASHEPASALCAVAQGHVADLPAPPKAVESTPTGVTIDDQAPVPGGTEVDREWDGRVRTLLRNDQLSERHAVTEYNYGGDLGRILAFDILDADGKPRDWFTSGDDMEVRLHIEALSEITDPIFAMTIKDSKGQDVYGTNTLFSRQPAPPLRNSDRRIVRFQLQTNLMPGEYFISLGFTQFIGAELLVVHRRYDAVKFSIHGADRCFGIANCFAKISVEPA